MNYHFSNYPPFLLEAVEASLSYFGVLTSDFLGLRISVASMTSTASTASVASMTVLIPGSFPFDLSPVSSGPLAHYK